MAMANEIRASYTDTFEHAFDVKGRITVPSEWREGSYESRLFIFPSSEKCLRVFPESWLGRLQEKAATLKDSDPMRKQVESLASIAQFTTFDQQGRIMVKEKLRTGAGLRKEAVLVGRLDHFQIWDKTGWQSRPGTTTTVEEALGAMGL
jgi:MraZ protein